MFVSEWSWKRMNVKNKKYDCVARAFWKMCDSIFEIN
jgi:hypothetical protein